MGTKKKVTTKDVAEAAGVSQSTVSMILSGCTYSSFSEETKQKVYQACISTGYRSIAPKNTDSTAKLILTVCSSCENMDYLKAVEMIQKSCSARGYESLTFFSLRDPEAEERIVSMIDILPVAGVIFLYQPQNTWLLPRLEALRPTISVCDHNPNINFDAIEMNSIEIGSIIAQHLIDFGHSKVAYVAPEINDKHPLRQRRLEGVKEAFLKNEYDPDECICLCTCETESIDTGSGINDYEAGFILANRIIDKYKVSAIIGNNDMVCYGIIDALQRRKKRIPQDYTVVGCDNIVLSNMKSISLTTVENFTTLRASEAVELLLKKIQRASAGSEKDFPLSTVKVEYKPKLIKRSSSAPVK